MKTAGQPTQTEIATEDIIFVRLEGAATREIHAREMGFSVQVFRRGDRALLNKTINENLVIVQSGSFKIQNGHGQTLQVFGRGEIFANPPSFRQAGSPHLQARIMEAELRLYILPWAQANDLLLQHPDFLLQLFELMAGRKLRAQDGIHWTRLSVQERVVLLLNDLLDRYGAPFGRFEMIDLPLTKIDMAHLTGTVQESIVRVISALRAQGLISSHGKRLIIHDTNRLREMKKALLQTLGEASATGA